MDASTQSLLNRGARLTELLKQAQYMPIAVEHMVVIIYAGVKGYLDKIPVKKVTAFEAGLVPFVTANAPEIFEAIKKDNEIKPDTDAKIKKTLEDYVKSFAWDEYISLVLLVLFLACNFVVNFHWFIAQIRDRKE